VCRPDDDIGNGGGDADLDARVTFLSQLVLEELVQLGVEDAIGDELSTLRTVVGENWSASRLGEPCNLKARLATEGHSRDL
jgi:hypothetical protein